MTISIDIYMYNIFKFLARAEGISVEKDC